MMRFAASGLLSRSLLRSGQARRSLRDPGVAAALLAGPRRFYTSQWQGRREDGERSTSIAGAVGGSVEEPSDDDGAPAEDFKVGVVMSAASGATDTGTVTDPGVKGSEHRSSHFVVFNSTYQQLQDKLDSFLSDCLSYIQDTDSLLQSLQKSKLAQHGIDLGNMDDDNARYPPLTARKTPREIVEELDKYVIGQAEAKRAVAVALRNRWRRHELPPNIKDRVTPKNILMIGPTGVGKSEIARRLAKLTDAPFIKVEATRYMRPRNSGRSGDPRDIEHAIHELVHLSVQAARDKTRAQVRDRIHDAVENRLIDDLLSQEHESLQWLIDSSMSAKTAPTSTPGLASILQPPTQQASAASEMESKSNNAIRQLLRDIIRRSRSDDRMIEFSSLRESDIEAAAQAVPLEGFAQILAEMSRSNGSGSSATATTGTLSTVKSFDDAPSDADAANMRIEKRRLSDPEPAANPANTNNVASALKATADQLRSLVKFLTRRSSAAFEPHSAGHHRHHPPHHHSQDGLPGTQGASAADSASASAGAASSPSGGSGGRTARMRMRVRDALSLLAELEASILLNDNLIVRTAIQHVEQDGIVFIDDIDKLCVGTGSGSGSIGKTTAGYDQLFEPIQRDLLPLIEGTLVTTPFGVVRTDHILFIASGSFRYSQPSDLLPELQGRFPIRVQLRALTETDLYQLLTMPQSNLIAQQCALLRTEGIDLKFTQAAIQEIAKIAFEVNSTIENIGARRLNTILERVVDEISFAAPEKAKMVQMESQLSEMSDERTPLMDQDLITVVIDADHIQRTVDESFLKSDLSRFVL